MFLKSAARKYLILAVILCSRLISLEASVLESVQKQEPTEGIRKSVFHFIRFSGKKPRAVLVLCPGQNGSGGEYLSDERWREFARKNDMVILVPDFESPDQLLASGGGYFVAAKGSGALLLQALQKENLSDVPLLLYGFSGGAHFVISFAAWAPKGLLAFCAYSFGWWSPPPNELRCPAVIACGEMDGMRYASSFGYFQAGRQQGKPWAWVSLKRQNHGRSEQLESFTREYFQGVLDCPSDKRIVIDNIRKTLVKGARCDFLMTSVLPCAAVFPSWRTLHDP